MKKRILSILLAVMMVVPMLTMAIPVSAAGEPETIYSWNGFKETDIRNYVDGQVIDLGFKGEATTAPTIDGIIDDGEYTTTSSIPKRYKSGTAPVSLPLYVAVKEQYLYVAFEYAGEEACEDIQYDIGVMGTHTSNQGWNRVTLTTTGEGKINGAGQYFTHHSKAGYTYVDTPYVRDFFADFAHSNGVYEAKFDLAGLYRYFANYITNEGVWDSPIVQFWFFYDVDATGVGQTQYVHPISVNIGAAETVSFVGKSIIIPQSAFEYIRDNFRATLGKEGYDSRNCVPSQYATLNEYIETAPTMDGVIGNEEYTTSVVHEQTKHAGYGDITGYYAVKDGYLYAAWQFEDSSAKNFIVQYGLSGSDFATMFSRTGQTIKTDGSIGYQQNYLYKNALDVTADFNTFTIMGGKGKAAAQAITAAGYKHVEGVTTVEVRIALAHLIQSYKDAGWNAQNANAVAFTMFPDSSAEVGWVIPDDVVTQVRRTTGVNYNPGAKYVVPCVILPKGCVDKYDIEDVDDLEAFGQKHLHAAPSVVTLDGKINEGEYTAQESYNQLRSGDGVAVPDVTENVNGTNYFAYDDDYIYVGAKVYDPNYKSGKSSYQFNISVLNKNDGKFEIGDGVTRLNSMWYVYSDGTTNKPTVGGVMRTQTCYKIADDDKETPDVNEAAGNYAGQDAWLAAAKTAMGTIPLAGSYDPETKTITYEAKISRAALMEAFGVDEMESFNYMNYIVYGDGTVGWTLYKTLNNGGAYDALKALGYIHNAGVLNYTNDHFLHVVHLDGDVSTRKGASVRLSASNSGLRFKTHYTEDYLAYMAAYAKSVGEEMKVGTLIAPYDYVEAAGEFTHEALEAVYNANPYVEVFADVNNPYLNKNGVVTIAGSIVNINPSNYGREFAGIGFIQIGDEYFYSEASCVKSISEVATLALADTKPVADSDYKYEVSAGVYSPYDEGKRTILNGFIVK